MALSVLEILKDHRLISVEDADRVLNVSQETGNPIGRLLVDLKILNEKELYLFICNNLGMNPTFMYSDRRFDVAGLTIPKFQVSGDFFGYFPLEEGRIAITLSDVSGKGLEAGLLAIELANVLRESIRMKSVIPSVMMRKVNQISQEFFGAEQFATFIILILDMHSGTVEFCCAGSPPILVFRSREKIVEEMEVKGIPVGIYSDFLFNGGRCNLNTGDIMLLYSDGAYECQNVKGEFYGVERIKNNLVKSHTRSARGLLHKMRREIKFFSLFRGLNDDTTYIAIKKNRER